jgi:hypothetical protein
MVMSYFSGRWGQNLSGQATMHSTGASATQPPPTKKVLARLGYRTGTNISGARALGCVGL